MKIFLMGFMASGKTTLGKKLANKIGWDFIDLDKRIEDGTGKSISEIFSSAGEAAFREIESTALDEILKIKDDTVIATGGGTPCHQENLPRMNEAGLTVFLDADVAVILKRLRSETIIRPLLPDDKNEWEDFVNRLLEKREPYYNQCKLKIAATKLNEEEIFKIILKNLRP